MNGKEEKKSPIIEQAYKFTADMHKLLKTAERETAVIVIISEKNADKASSRQVINIDGDNVEIINAFCGLFSKPEARELLEISLRMLEHASQVKAQKGGKA